MSKFLFLLLIPGMAAVATEPPSPPAKPDSSRYLEHCSQLRRELSHTKNCEPKMSLVENFYDNCNVIGEGLADADDLWLRARRNCVLSSKKVNLGTANKVTASQRSDLDNAQRNLEGNKDNLGNCAEGMAKAEKKYRDIAKAAKEKAYGKTGCPGDIAKAYKIYERLAEDGATKAKAEGTEYRAAAEKLDKKGGEIKGRGEDLNSVNKGDTNKGGDENAQKGGGPGGMPKLPEIPQKKDDSAKKAAEMKAELAKEKAMRVKQCQTNEGMRNAAIATCKSTYVVLPGYATGVQALQEKCINDANTAYGAVTNCSLVQ